MGRFESVIQLDFLNYGEMNNCMWFCSCDIVMILQIGVLGHYQAWHNYVLIRLIHGRVSCVLVCWKCMDLVHVKFYRHYFLETICLDWEHRHEKFNLSSTNTTHHANILKNLQKLKVIWHIKVIWLYEPTP